LMLSFFEKFLLGKIKEFKLKLGQFKSAKSLLY